MEKINYTKKELMLELERLKNENEYLKLKNQKDNAEEKSSDEELQQSHKKLSAIISASPDGIGALSLDGRMQFISNKLAEMYGYSIDQKDQFIGKPVLDFVEPTYHPKLIDNIKKLLEHTNDYNLNEYVAIKKDGTHFHAEVNSTLIRDSDGKPESILLVERDITDRKLKEEELKQSNEKWEALIAASPDGIGLISLDGKILLISDKLVLMHGYDVKLKTQYYGMSIFDFIDPSSHNILVENTHKLLSGKLDEKPTEYLALKKDKSQFIIDVRTSILRDLNGNPKSILYVERDITERKRAEEQIKEKNRELAELNATKDKFFSIIAHDLKSPFQGLLGYSQILTSEYSSLTEEEIISSIHSIDELSQSTYKLLENLLQWSRMQTGQMKIEFEDFNLLVELYPTLSLVKQTALNKNIEFHYEIDSSVFIKADQNMLSAIVRNLISNAIKFTNPGGKITLITRKYKGFIEFSVTDTGVGIEAENIEKLFKVDANLSRKGTANEEGTGLGLLLCKEMISKHGGEIRVESEVNKGTTFLFTIPT